MSDVEKELLESVPNQMFFNLKECCQLKGINYKTICNKTYLQPNKGKGVKIGGRKCFRKDVVLNWLLQTDSMLV